MAEERQVLLCIGGSHDGQRVQVTGAVVRLPMGLALEPRPGEAFQLEEYYRMPFRAGDYVVEVLAHASLPAAEVLRRLVDGYRPGA